VGDVLVIDCWSHINILLYQGGHAFIQDMVHLKWSLNRRVVIVHDARGAAVLEASVDIGFCFGLRVKDSNLAVQIWSTRVMILLDLMACSCC
jgi:hypothetical protein